MSGEEPAAAQDVAVAGVLPGRTDFGHLLEELHEDDVVRRAAHLAAERAQDLSMLAIATALQDDVDQAIRTAAIILHNLNSELGDDPRARTLTRVEDQLTRAGGRLQRLILEIRPPLLERLGLAATLRTLLEGVSLESGLKAELIDGLIQEPPADTQINLFRIACEAIDNVRRYAQATAMTVEVRTYAGGYMVRVADNGRGLQNPAEPDTERPGFLIMRQRAELRDGWWQAHSTPGEGTTVEVWTPGAARPPAAAPRDGVSFVVE